MKHFTKALLLTMVIGLFVIIGSTAVIAASKTPQIKKSTFVQSPVGSITDTDIVSEPADETGCVNLDDVPYDPNYSGAKVFFEDTVLCTGDYEFVDSDGGVFVRILADDVTFDCNGSRLWTQIPWNSRYYTWGINTYHYGSDIFSNNVTVKNCIIDGFKHGMEIYTYSNNNIIHRNSFINNETSLRSYSSTTSLDYNGLGNHWGYYDEPGEGCNDTDNNGMCDSQYGGGNLIDHFPLTGAPVITPIEDITVDEMGWAFINVGYFDPTNDIAVTDVEAPFGSMVNCWPNRPDTFGWKPGMNDSGDYTVTVSASDSGHTTTQDVDITVTNTCDSGTGPWDMWPCVNYPQQILCYG